MKVLTLQDLTREDSLRLSFDGHFNLEMEPNRELEPLLQKVLGNGGGKVASQAVTYFERLEELLARIQESGVELKDINSGLLDFPCLRDGREVYLVSVLDPSVASTQKYNERPTRTEGTGVTGRSA